MTQRTDTTVDGSGYTDNVVWGSIDPVDNGNISPYSGGDSATIEAAYQSGESGTALSIYGGVRINFNDGRAYQQTATGYRSVFRTVLEETGEAVDARATAQHTVAHDVYWHERSGSWYLSANKMTNIGLLVDVSGSMTPTYTAVVEQGLEEFVAKQKDDVAHRVAFYGSTFSHELQHHFDGLDLKADGALEAIKAAFYAVRPSGLTAYYDATVNMITSIERRCLPEDEVVMCIVTDGSDTGSRQASLQQMQQVIAQKKAAGWTIVMIGVNAFDSEAAADQYGIGRGGALSAGTSATNIRDTFAGVSAGVARVRGGQDSYVQFSQEERDSSAGR
jgi:hypothetical protein